MNWEERSCQVLPTHVNEGNLGHQDPCFEIKIDKDFSWAGGYNIRFALGLHHKSEVQLWPIGRGIAGPELSAIMMGPKSVASDPTEFPY